MPDYPPGWVVDQQPGIWIPSEDGNSVRYAYYYDEFTTPEDSPMTSPRTCEPGPGLINLVQSDNAAFWIDCNSRLNVRGPDTPGWTKQYVHTNASIARQAGLLFSGKFMCRSLLCNLIYGWSSAVSGIYTTLAGPGIYHNSNQLLSIEADGTTSRVIGTTTPGVEYEVALMLQDMGLVQAIRDNGGQFPEWTTVWVDSIDVTDPLWPHIWIYRQDGWLDDFQVSLAEALQPLVYDNFNRVNSPTIGGPCDAEWTVESGNWEISGNKLLSNTAVGGKVYIESGKTDCVASVIVNSPSGTCGLIVREEGAASDNYVYARITIGGAFEILEVTGGIPNQLATITPASIPASTDIRIQVILAGSSIKAYMDGDNDLEATLTTRLTGTKVGLAKGATAGVTFDDFYVWPRTWENI